MQPAAGAANTYAFKNLDTGSRAFRHADRNAHRIAGIKGRQAALFINFGALLGFQLRNNIHQSYPYILVEKPERPTFAAKLSSAGNAHRTKTDYAAKTAERRGSKQGRMHPSFIVDRVSLNIAFAIQQSRLKIKPQSANNRHFAESRQRRLPAAASSPPLSGAIKAIFAPGPLYFCFI